jgi:Flp pilus assembly protein TadD
MRRLPALVAALLLPTTPLILGSAVVSATLLVTQAPAQAQSADAVAKVAQAITVRIEGGTQGSGVLVKRDGNRYTVLTSWHVVSGQGKGEELDIFVRDGTRQQLEQGSIKRLGDVDLAVLTFTSTNSYEVAQIGDIKSVSMGNPIWVSGFPLPSSAIPTRQMRFIKGDVIANTTVAIPDGYQLLYDNQTLPGVSGGAVLNAQGQLVGIHGKAEKADQISESSGKAVATGTNQGVPISYYKQYTSGAAVIASSTQAATADDYLVLAALLLDKKGSESEAIRLVDKSIELVRTAKGYSYRAYVKNNLGNFDGAVTDYGQAITISPKSSVLYNNRGNAKGDLGDYAGAIADFDQAIAIDAREPSFYANRGFARAATADKTGAMADYNQALSINPRWIFAYNNRGVLKANLGDKRGAIADYKQVIELDSKFAMAYWNLGSSYYSLREFGLACENWRVAASLGVSVAAEVVGDRRYGCR